MVFYSMKINVLGAKFECYWDTRMWNKNYQLSVVFYDDFRKRKKKVEKEGYSVPPVLLVGESERIG